MEFERVRGNLGFFLGLTFFVLIILIPTPQVFIEHAKLKLQVTETNADVLKLAYSMKVVLALLILMITWWISEAVPIPVTSLLPGVILPLFHTYGFQDGKFIELNGKNVFLNYANPIIFLFLAGFLIAGAMQKWGLDRRIALWILTRGKIAQSPGKILFGLIVASAFISMWVSNTATTAMMLPIALGVLNKLNVDQTSKYAKAIMLGVAFASSIGGIGTIIGTPPNGIAVSILSKEKIIHINFLKWMSFGIPFVIFALPILWLVLKLTFKFNFKFNEEIKELLVLEKNKLGKLSKAEKLTLSVFIFTALLWVTNPLWNFIPVIGEKLEWFDEYLIAVFGCITLFILPINFSKREFILDWKDSKYVDWGTLLLFGGGIALSDALFKTGLANVIASEFIKTFGKPSTYLLVFIVVIFMDLLTEVTSNTAVTSMMVPILISICTGLGVEPTVVVISATIAASMAFMLPVATPPNALVYGMRYVTLKDMLKAGFALDIIAWLYITIYFYVLNLLGFKF
jgi:sodium-dependent dicarboxylate transporter 2/3/5